MPWGRLDDEYHENRKILSVSFGARWIHVAAISWCSKHQTDGVIPKRKAYQLGAEDEACRPIEWIQELLSTGLFEEHGDAEYLVHDFLVYNPSAEENAARREAIEEKARKGGQARIHGARRDARGRLVRPADQPQAGQTTSQRTSHGLDETPARHPARHQPHSPLPINPVPTSQKENHIVGQAEKDPPARRRTARASPNGDLRKTAIEILDWLNEKTGRAYRNTDANISLIEGRLREGLAPAVLRKIVSVKTREWGADEKMCHYLRPATLFNRTKCEQYVGELGPETLADLSRPDDEEADDAT
jgi:uncharacterized phage protein (TIGR02220 family)